MDRSQKRLFDRVSSFFQRRWWKKPHTACEKPAESVTTLVPELQPQAIIKPGTIKKQDSAVSVSSTNKTGHAFDGTNDDSKSAFVTTEPIINISLMDAPVATSPSRRRSTVIRQSQLSKPSFRQISVPLQPSSDSNSDVVSDLLHGVETMSLKNKSTIRKPRTLLRNRRATNRRQSNGLKQASELAARLNECSFRSVSPFEIRELRDCLQNGDHHVNSIQLGRKAVFSNLQPIYLIRDLLFGSMDRDKLAGFSISTRLSLLEVLDQLQTIDIELGTGNTNTGYKLLYELLSDSPADKNTSVSIPNLPGTTLMNRSLPIRKAKSSQDMRNSGKKLKFSSWMYELQITVDQSIKPASFLTGVLDYQFDSSPVHFSQKSLPPTPDESICRQNYFRHDASTPDANGQKTLMSLVDSTTIIYLNTHLKLMRKVIDCPPVELAHQYGPLERENVRREFLKSGFSSIAASLLACPYPDLRNSYIDLLTPLLHS
ncbi:hypothetical protein NQZ79_g120 [Umbelopsis isabellina]|nr:hypothetical protein NQZ79_g120 [Umbelopsis isabellina]